MNSRRRRQAVFRSPIDEKRSATYLHPYPNGWYRLVNSAELRPGERHYMECLGRQLVLWRTEDGTANVMNAFCPHLGANLAHGCVIGDRIECAFHGWQFTGDGRAAHVPYSEHIPQGVLTVPFPIQEVHGQLFMYHDSCSEKPDLDEAPPYPVPSIPELAQGTFVYRGAYDAGRVKMNIVEFAENSVDKAHFPRVHGHMRFPWTQVKMPGVTIEHDTDCYFDSDIDWKMYFIDTAILSVFGRRIVSAGASAKISFYGPGSLVKFRFTLPKLGDIEMYQTHLPVGPLELQVNFRWFADRRINRLLVWYVIGNWISQWERDISIWENKIYQQNPRLSRDDGRIFKLRDWYRQFLPKDQPSE